MVSTPLKNISHNENLPQVGVKIQNVWNHHLEKHFTIKRPAHLSEPVRCDTLALAKESSSPNKRSSVQFKKQRAWWFKPWPFWDGEFTWPLKKGWKVTSNVWGSKGHFESPGDGWEDLVAWWDMLIWFLRFFWWNQKCSSKDCMNKFYMLQGNKTEIWNPDFIEFWRRKKHSCSVNITCWACFKTGVLKNPLVSKVNWTTYFQQTLLLFWRFPKIPCIKDFNIWTEDPNSTVPKCPKRRFRCKTSSWNVNSFHVIDRVIFFCGVHRVAKSTSFWGVSFVEIDPPLF